MFFAIVRDVVEGNPPIQQSSFAQQNLSLSLRGNLTSKSRPVRKMEFKFAHNFNVWLSLYWWLSAFSWLGVKVYPLIYLPLHHWLQLYSDVCGGFLIKYMNNKEKVHHICSPEDVRVYLFIYLFIFRNY